MREAKAGAGRNNVHCPSGCKVFVFLLGSNRASAALN
jgi:hypothetical protein